MSELPNGWVETKLIEICDVILGQSPPSDTYNDIKEGLPFYQGKTEFGKNFPVPRKWCNSPNKIAIQNDILLSVRAPVGPTNLCYEESCIGRGLAAIRPTLIEYMFIYYYFKRIESDLSGKGTGTTFKAITGDVVKSISVPLPPLAEQKRIVEKIEALFSRLDAGIAALEKTKSQLKRYKQSVLKAAFEGKLNEPYDVNEEWVFGLQSHISNSLKTKKKFKPISYDEALMPVYPTEWVVTNVFQICNSIQYGTSEKAIEEPTNTPVLRMGNIQDGKIIYENLKYFPDDWDAKKDFILNEGDVLFNRTNSAELVGKSAIYKEQKYDCVFASYLIRASVDKKIYNSDFLCFFLNSFYGRRYISSVISQQVGQANVNGTKLGSIPVPIIPIGLQDIIVKEIERLHSKADKTMETVESELKKAQALKSKILEYAFTGKLVPQAPDDEPADKLLERIMAEKEASNPKKKTRKRK